MTGMSVATICGRTSQVYFNLRQYLSYIVYERAFENSFQIVTAVRIAM